MPRRYWYKLYYRECALCGRESHWRERVYGVKPVDPAERIFFKLIACGCHFV